MTTFAPTVLVNCGLGVGRVQGYGAASIWKQRAHRWTVSALRITGEFSREFGVSRYSVMVWGADDLIRDCFKVYGCCLMCARLSFHTGKSLYSFFTYNAAGGLLPNIAFRLYRFREYKIIFIQILYIPFCVVILARGLYKEFLVLKFGLFIFPLLRNLFINYIAWRGQPELQVTLETVLLSPFYNFFLIMCAVHGRLKCLLWYLPEVPPNHGMLQETKPRDIQSIRVMMPPTFERELETARFAQQKRQERSPRDSIASLGYDMYDGDALLGSETFENPVFDAVTSFDSRQSDAAAEPRLLNTIGIAARRPSGFSNFNRNDYFEYFFRDGASVFISFKAGGIRLENPSPGSIPLPPSLNKINPILRSEPSPDVVAKNEHSARRRTSDDAVKGILKNQAQSPHEAFCPPAQKKASLGGHVSFSNSLSFGSEKGAATRYRQQYESFQEANDDCDDDLEVGNRSHCGMGDSNYLRRATNDAAEFELMKNRADSESLDMALSGEVALHAGLDADAVDVDDTYERQVHDLEMLKWVDALRLSDMIHQESNKAYHNSQIALDQADGITAERAK